MARDRERLLQDPGLLTRSGHCITLSSPLSPLCRAGLRQSLVSLAACTGAYSMGLSLGWASPALAQLETNTTASLAPAPLTPAQARQASHITRQVQEMSVLNFTGS